MFTVPVYDSRNTSDSAALAIPLPLTPVLGRQPQGFPSYKPMDVDPLA